MAAIAGKKNKDATTAPNKENPIVKASGWKSFPATPSNAKIGKKQHRIITVEKVITLPTSRTALYIIASFFFWLNCPLYSVRHLKMFSIKITAPSTIIPKSTAPILSRFAGIPNNLNNENANAKASGITKDAIKVIRK